MQYLKRDSLVLHTVFLTTVLREKTTTSRRQAWKRCGGVTVCGGEGVCRGCGGGDLVRVGGWEEDVM